MYLAIVYHLHGGHLPVRTGSAVNVAYRQGPILHRANRLIWPELAAGQLNQIMQQIRDNYIFTIKCTNIL